MNVYIVIGFPYDGMMDEAEIYEAYSSEEAAEEKAAALREKLAKWGEIEVVKRRVA